MKCQNLVTPQESWEKASQKKKQEQRESTEEKEAARRERRRLLVIARRKKYPWERKYESAKARCENPKTAMYYCYGARGIKMMMTKYDFLFLWNRDGAAQMKKPSIDRIDNNGNYELSNCRFIELSANVSRAKSVQIKRISPSGEITTYKCITEALEELNGGKTGNITSCARGRRKSAFGYRWEYVSIGETNEQNRIGASVDRVHGSGEFNVC